MKNECGKTRKKEDPYEIWQSTEPVFDCPAGSWEWRVLKKWQTPDKEQNNPYARWFCFVTSPMCPGGEYGDGYVRDVVDHARMIHGQPDLRKVMRPNDQLNLF